MVFFMMIASAQERAAMKSLDEADGLWSKGQKAEAVVKYKGLIDGSASSLDQSRRPTAFQRVIEHEVEQGNTSSAKQYALKAESLNVAVASDAPAVRKLLAEVKTEKEVASRKNDDDQEVGTGGAEPRKDAGQYKKARKKAKGDELKGMSLEQITSLIGPPDETYQSRKPPQNAYLYVWKVEEGNFIVVSFIRRIDNGQATILVAVDNRTRAIVENMKKALDKV